MTTQPFIDANTRPELKDALTAAVDAALAAGLPGSDVAGYLRAAATQAPLRAISALTGLDPNANSVVRFEALTRKLTATPSGAELLVGAGNYRPTVDVSQGPEYLELADLYDAMQVLAGDPRRAHRAGLDRLARQQRRARVIHPTHDFYDRATRCRRCAVHADRPGAFEPCGSPAEEDAEAAVGMDGVKHLGQPASWETTVQEAPGEPI